MNYFDLTGKLALVVGGATGLGFEMAKGLVHCGANVVIASRNLESLAHAVTRLNAEVNDGGAVKSLQLDITDATMRAVARRELQKMNDGKLDILIQSGGINIRSSLEQADNDDTRSVIETNLLGPMFLTKELFPLLRKSGAGRVINIASIFATVSYPDRSNYAVSKGGLLLLTKTLAAEWANENVTVNAISPGPFLTEINQKVLDDPENYKSFCRNIPVGRFGKPEEIITSAIYLSSPASSYVTGANIMVDGGWTAT